MLVGMGRQVMINFLRRATGPHQDDRFVDDDHGRCWVDHLPDQCRGRERFLQLRAGRIQPYQRPKASAVPGCRQTRSAV